MSYNGWENVETWRVSLWLHNDEGWYSICRDLVQMYSNDRYEIAEAIKNLVVDEEMPTVGGLYGDMLHSSFSDVAWEHIAESFMDEK